jgi:predicted transport protein
LTLTGYNSEYSDRPFTEKRDMKGGFKESPLRLNEDLRLLDTWDENAIKARAAKLTEKALKVWAAPKLPPEILALYRPKTVSEGYGVKDHPPLSRGAVGEVFEAFRKEVLALDPCVTEEFFKTVIAYKAETNFVDVVPQMKRLQLTLNMKLADLDDPKHLCEDVSELGHLGYGDVRLVLTSIGELPYVMGLVRQSFDKQMGGSDV